MMNMFLKYYLAFHILSHVIATNEIHYNPQGRLLSRKRRYLIFPEGSSFQLVYCLTVPTYAVEGSIFTFGATASLAWELPHDPYSPLRKPAEALHRRKDTMVIKNVTSYPNFVQPIWSQPSYSYQNSWNTEQNLVPMMGNFYDHSGYHQIHRRTRRDLYLKIEKFLTAQRKDGKACVLRALCEVSQASKSAKGTFMEAIMRTIFTWKVDPQENTEYDAVSSSQLQDCSQLYPTCETSILKLFQ